jgi:hypothetical protein
VTTRGMRARNPRERCMGRDQGFVAKDVIMQGVRGMFKKRQSTNAREKRGAGGGGGPIVLPRKRRLITSVRRYACI